ncbi:MAG TPA: hypothetical protein DDW31_06665 [candidate division Zixibacteria bacterium]|jgi:hypothetical protein|nr:hypothetical protein [candidate division Zixibacteria bacterium]
MRFPKGRSSLQNAKLEFVHLDNILADNKKERASKISGYIEIIYPDLVDFLYLKKGEPVNAGRFSRAERKQVAISDVIERAKKSTTGTVSIYEAPEELIDMIMATFSVEPKFKNLDMTSVEPDKLFEKLTSVKFDGFVEVKRGVDISYIRIKEGLPTAGYFTWKVDNIQLDTLKAALKAAATAPGAVVIDGYDKLPVMAEQASPAQISLFVNALNKVVSEMRNAAGPTVVTKTLASSKESATVHFPFLKDFNIGEAVAEQEKVLATAEELGAAFAEWMDNFVDSFRMVLGSRLDGIVQAALKDSRFALKSSSFGRRSKLKDLL